MPASPVAALAKAAATQVLEAVPVLAGAAAPVLVASQALAGAAAAPAAAEEDN